MIVVDDKVRSIKLRELSRVIIIIRGSCYLRGCIYSLGSLLVVIPMLVFVILNDFCNFSKVEG